MSWSATEIAALATKAARGCGAPPAQAELFGRVAALHLMTGGAADDVAAALDALPGGPILSYPLALDDALLSASQGGAAVVQEGAENALMHSYVAALPFPAELVISGQGEAKLSVDLSTPRKRVTLGRITGCDMLVEKMARLADRTLVPESESSRLSGAGAGLTDND